MTAVDDASEAGTSPVPPPGPPKRRAYRDPFLWRRLGASALAGLVTAFAFAPVDLGPLALIGLVPLLWAWRSATPGRAFWCGFAFGAAQMAIVCSWVFYFGAVAIVPFVAIVALYPAAAGLVVAVLARNGVRSPFVTAAALTLFEWLRGHFPIGGLEWGELGVALHGAAPARALATYGGVPLLTYLVVLVNAFVLDLILALAARRRRAGAFAACGLAGIVLATALGVAFRFEPTRTGELRYALLQANDVDRYFTADELAGDPLTTRHFALADELQGKYDLIVFPESSLDGNDPVNDPMLRSRLAALARSHDATVIANGIVWQYDDGPPKSYNTNVVFGPDGEIVGTYSKMHLVPFGEYVPFPVLRNFIPALSQIAHDFTPGPRRQTFEIGGHRVGTVICFESGFARSVRPYVVDDGAEAIVVTTNNRSYRRSANSAQHVAMSQMRAAELGRPVLHSAVSGITAVIDAEGDVVARAGLFDVATTEGRVATTTGLTPYARFGDWTVLVCVLVLGGGALWILVRRVRSTRRADPGGGRGAPARVGPED